MLTSDEVAARATFTPQYAAKAVNATFFAVMPDFSFSCMVPPVVGFVVLITTPVKSATSNVYKSLKS
jgi:hypothetical protein